MTSGVPQESVLCPSLFIFIYQMYVNLFKNFADDSKLFTPIRSVDDHINLQLSIDQLSGLKYYISGQLNLIVINVKSFTLVKIT